MTDLLNKLNEKLKALKIDNKKLPLIAVTLSLLILYLDFTFILRVQMQGIRALTPKVAGLKKALNSLSKDLPRLQDLELRHGKDKAAAGAPRLKEVISQDKVLLLLQEISDIANKNKIKVTQINTAKDAKAKEEVIAGERLLPLTIKLDLSCGYHSLGSFLNGLENARYFMGLENLKIVRDPKNYLLQNVNLVLKTYARK